MENKTIKRKKRERERPVKFDSECKGQDVERR